MGALYSGVHPWGVVEADLVAVVVVRVPVVPQEAPQVDLADPATAGGTFGDPAWRPATGGSWAA